MKNYTFYLPVSFLFFIAFASCAAAAAPTRDCVLDNSFLRREIKSDRSVHTTLFVNKLTGAKYKLDSDEFRLSLDNGAVALTSRDFTIGAAETNIPGRCVYTLSNKKYGVAVKLTYELPAGAFWTRKYIEVEAGARLVNEIDVERFKTGALKIERFDTLHESNPPWDWPGGRPIFIDRQLFAGLEYPAGYNESENGVVRLHHYPGRAGRILSKTAVIGAGRILSKTAVIGVAANRVNRRVEDAFADYLSRIRIHPPRRFILWNAYFHKLEGDGSMSEIFSDSDVKKKFTYGKKLFTDVGVKPDSVLIDGGWADPKSLMEEDHRAPGRVKYVHELAAKYFETPIGVHVITHGRRSTIDRPWMRENFDMIDKDSYCFADPRAADLEIKNLLDDQKRHNINAFKFDWGNFLCKQTNHRGHLPGDRYAREAITDNQIRMLTALHGADPNVYLYNTGWFSPWWLLYYDSVFSGENDYDVPLVGPPAFSINEMQETWRDEVIRRNIVDSRSQFPLNSLMNHSPVMFRWNHDYLKFDHGPLETFSDTFLINYLRGNGLIEMYMNVFNLTDQQRKIWGQITQWAKANDDIILADSKFIGGDPFQGKIYGYAHFNKYNNGIIGLRNPDFLARDFSFALDEKTGFLDDGKPYTVSVAYPYEEPLGAGFKYGDIVKVKKIARGGVVVLEVKAAALASAGAGTPGSVSAAEKPAASKLRLDKKSGSVSGEYEIAAPAGVKTQIVFLTRITSFKDQNKVKLAATLNGAPAAVIKVENRAGMETKIFMWEILSGWVLHTIELPAGKNTVRFDLAAPGGKFRAWLAVESPADNSLPVFPSGLPAAWKNAAKSEYELF
ncbi:MAG: hypothetical protein WCX65_08970 [bacterium]